MDNAKPEKNTAHQFDEMVAEPVGRIHNQLATERFSELANDYRQSLIRSFANSLIEIHLFHFQSPDDFADNGFDGEVRTINDVRVFCDDQRGQAP